MENLRISKVDCSQSESEASVLEYEFTNDEIDKMLERSYKFGNQIISQASQLEMTTKIFWCSAFIQTHPKFFISIFDTHFKLYSDILMFAKSYLEKDMLKFRTKSKGFIEGLKFIDSVEKKCDQKKYWVDSSIGQYANMLDPTDYAYEGLESHLVQIKEEIHNLIDEIENYVKSTILLPYIKSMETFQTKFIKNSLAQRQEECTEEKTVGMGESQQADYDVNSKEPSGDICLSRGESTSEAGKMLPIRLEYISYRYHVASTIYNWLNSANYHMVKECGSLRLSEDMADFHLDSQYLECQKLDQVDELSNELSNSRLRYIHVLYFTSFNEQYHSLLSEHFCEERLFACIPVEYNEVKILTFLGLVKLAYEKREKAHVAIINLFKKLKGRTSLDMLLNFFDTRSQLFEEFGDKLNAANHHQAALEEELSIMRYETQQNEVLRGLERRFKEGRKQASRARSPAK